MSLGLQLRWFYKDITVPRCAFGVTDTSSKLAAAPGTCCRRHMCNFRSVLQFSHISCACAEEPSEEGKAALHGCTVTAVLDLWLKKRGVEDDHMLYRLKQAASAGAWSTHSRDPSHLTSLPQQKAGH